MLAYHAAQDPYHSVFRMLRLLRYDPGKIYEREKLQILDFYLLFPELIQDIRLTRGEISNKRQVSPEHNEYHLTGEPKRIFRQMRPLQENALGLLVSTGIVEKNGNEITLQEDNVPSELLASVDRENTEDPDVVSYLVEVVGDFPAFGKNGLKHRTGLLEHRYDVT